MNKNDVVIELSKRLNISMSDANLVVNTVLDIIKEGIKEHGKVQFREFGYFEKYQTFNKNDYFQSTKSKYYSVKFKPYRKFKNYLDEKD